MILSIHDLGARRGLIVHATNRLIYSRINLVPVAQEAGGREEGPFWTGMENLVPTRV